MSRKAHEPTEKTRGIAKALSTYGIRHEHIATELGIDDKTLRKYYKTELAQGAARSMTAIAKSAYHVGVELLNPTMLIFLCKARLQWRETSDLEVSGEVAYKVSDKPLTPKEFAAKYLAEKSED